MESYENFMAYIKSKKALARLTNISGKLIDLYEYTHQTNRMLQD
jgi:hypothetical protein